MFRFLFYPPRALDIEQAVIYWACVPWLMLGANLQVASSLPWFSSLVTTGLGMGPLREDAWRLWSGKTSKCCQL